MTVLSYTYTNKIFRKKILKFLENFFLYYNKNIIMRHIVSANELERHKIEEEDGADCNCFTNVEINQHTQDLYIIHKSFNREFYISQDDIRDIFLFVANDPNYEGGNVIVDEAEGDEND